MAVASGIDLEDRQGMAIVSIGAAEVQNLRLISENELCADS